MQTSTGVVLMVVGGLTVIGSLMWGLPQYSVWQQGLSGEARLKYAEQEKRIAVESARAKLDAADLLNQAEIKRAEGLAKANEIIGKSLRGQDEYLRYLWIQAMTDEEGEGTRPTIIYVPTEAGLPLLEAGKR